MRLGSHIPVTSSILVLLTVSVCLLAVPLTGHAWTSAGPWGGVIHDLANAPAGGDTLYAGTGNGLYMYNMASGGETWVSFENTNGYRVLQILPDTGAGSVYAIARRSEDPFEFEETPWSGFLFELDLSTGSFEQIFGVDDPATSGTDETLQVSSMTTCGDSGDLIVTTFDEIYVDVADEYIIGYTYTKPAGSDNFNAAVDPGWYPFPLPIRTVLGQAGSSTLYVIRSDGNYSDIVRSDDCGTSSWWPSEKNVNNYAILTGGAEPFSIGAGPGDEVLLGTGDGVVYQRVSGGNWQVYGTGLPPFPVVDFGADIQGRPIAILRKHHWNLTNADDPAAGAWYLDGATWRSAASYNFVSSKVRKVLPAGSDEWVAYDQAGIWRFPGGSWPAVQSDTGIAAADLDGVVLDPRSDRVLAFGSSGIFEQNNGIWSRLQMSYVGSVIDNDYIYDAMQHMRDDRYISGSFSFRDETIWIGSWDSGLLRGTRFSDDPPNYRFDQVHLGSSTSDRRVSDIMTDPFDQNTIWFTKSLDGEGIYRSMDGGVTFSSMTGHLDTNGSYKANVLTSDLLEPDQRAILVGVDTAQTSVPGVLVMEGEGSLEETTLYMNQPVGGVAFNPADLGTKRALAGAKSCPDTMAIAGSNGSWALDSSIASPDGLPSSQVIKSIQIPLGIDDDGRADAFAVAHQNGTSFMGLFHSNADTYQGSPGGTWEDITGEITPFGPTSVTVDPKDGNLLWVTTRRGSAFTMYSDHFSDNAPPFIPLKPTVTGSTTGDTLRVDAQSVAADTVSTRTSLPMVRMTVKVTNTIDLTWMAPGDDGDMPGWADRYELYYSTAAIADSTDFAGAWTATVAAPNIAHYPEAYSLDVASHLGSWYSIALVAYDEGNRASPIQTISTGFTWDTGDTDLIGVLVELFGSVDKVAAVSVFRDGNSNGTFEVPGDIQIGSSSSTGPTMTVPVNISPIDGTVQTLFVVCDLASNAQSGDVINVGVTGMTIDSQDGVSGLPAWSGTIQVVALAADTGSGGGGGGGGCFIATAAYGSPMEPEVDLLRRYRDGYLVHRWWGRMLLKTYYTMSPKPAAFIADHPVLRQASRIALAPIIASVRAEGGSSIPAAVGLLIVGSAGAGGALAVFGLVGMITRRGKHRMGAWEHGSMGACVERKGEKMEEYPPSHKTAEGRRSD